MTAPCEPPCKRAWKLGILRPPVRFGVGVGFPGLRMTGREPETLISLQSRGYG